MNLYEYLKHRRIKQKDFAAQIHQSRPLVSQYCNGITRPSLAVALRIEEITEGAVTPRDLFEFYEQHRERTAALPADVPAVVAD